MQEEIRDALSRYLREEMSLRDFQRWFVPQTWADDPGDASTQELIDRIDLRLSEFTSGYWTEQDLRQELGEILQSQSIEVILNVQLRIRQLFTSSARPLHFVVSGELVGADIRP